MSYPTQWSCGHEWEGKRGRFPVPADIFILSMYSPAPMGAFKALLPKKKYIISLLFYTVNVYSDYIYIHIYIFRFISCVMFLCWCFLHVWCIPQQNSQRQFWSSVLLMSVCQGDMSPSGDTCLGRMLDPPTHSEFTLLTYIVIRLSEVKQCATVSCFTRPSSECCDNWPPWLASPFTFYSFQLSNSFK